MVKTKLMNLEEREKNRENEIEDIILDQQCLIKRLLSELNEVKKETKVGEIMTDAEINEMTNVSKYPTLKEMAVAGRSRGKMSDGDGASGSGVGASGSGGNGTSGMGAKKVVEAEFVDDINLDVDVDLTGDEVIGDAGSKKNVVEMSLVYEEEDD